VIWIASGIKVLKITVGSGNVGMLVCCLIKISHQPQRLYSLIFNHY